MDKTDDGKRVNVADGGAVPPISTKKNTLIGYDVHGNRQFPDWWYYTESQWDREIGWGKVPENRNIVNRQELEKLEMEIQYYPENLKPHTEQWNRILELRKILGMKV